MLKDKQARAGLHKLGQHSGHNPVELSRWRALLWEFNRDGEGCSRPGKRGRRKGLRHVIRHHGLADKSMRYRQGRSRPYQHGSGTARHSLEAERFETSVSHVSMARSAFKQHGERSSGVRGRLLREAILRNALRDSLDDPLVEALSPLPGQHRSLPVQFRR